MSKLRAYILCRFAEKSGIYNSWLDDCPIDYEVVDRFLPDWSLPADAGIVITHMHYRWEEISLLRRLYQHNRVPVLILADGILEYRNIFEHPDLADGAIFQPVMGHKLACIGRSQTRIVESWGNVGKCELVGIPRLDPFIGTDPEPLRESGPFRLLIATASTPAFDERQRETVLESLRHISGQLDRQYRINGRQVKVTWRLTDGLEMDLGVGSPDLADQRKPLSQVLDDVDAVITTPSTLYLESILKGRPTAILDFHNTPSYVTSAWMINSSKHFNWTLSELANPPKPKMLFQQAILQEQLFCAAAKPRMLKLIRTMIEIGEKTRREDRELRFPARILEDPQHGFEFVPAEFDLSQLYENNEAFQLQDVQALQVELSQAIKRLETLPRELAEKNVYLKEAMRQLDRLRSRNAELRARVANLRSRLGIQNRDLDGYEKSSESSPQDAQ